MQVKCNYCGSFIDEALETCPNCGAPNENIKRAASGVPRTIEELKAFCKEKNIPLDKFHFHIGEDYRGPQAFGIYYDDTAKEYVVYKNKSDGSRAVRYHGHDEGYAVNEIYQKLKEQIGDYKAYRASRGPVHSGPSQRGGSRPQSTPMPGIVTGILIFAGALIVICVLTSLLRGFSSGSGKHGGSDGSGYVYHPDNDYDRYDDDYGDYDDYDIGGRNYSDDSYDDDYYDDLDEYNRETIDSNWDDDNDFDWSWDDDDSWDSDDSWDWGSDDSWDSGGWDSDW